MAESTKKKKIEAEEKLKLKQKNKLEKLNWEEIKKKLRERFKKAGVSFIYIFSEK